MALDIKKVPHDAAQAYFDWSCLAIFGYMGPADRLLKQKGVLIRQAARMVLYNVRQQTDFEDVIFRGLLLKHPRMVRLAPDGRPWLSFSGDPQVASHFADFETGFNAVDDLVPPSETGGRIVTVKEWTRHNLGTHGYVIEHEPDYERDVLFHWKLLRQLPYLQSFGEATLMSRLKQKEVIVETLGRSFKVIPLLHWVPPVPKPQEVRVTPQAMDLIEQAMGHPRDAVQAVQSAIREGGGHAK